MKFLNLGCGNKFFAGDEWLNADMLPLGKGVIRCNFLDGIPFKNDSFDLVYHSHVLEHFSKKDGAVFIKECFRILKPGGVIRIVLPNLEVIAKEYLQQLEMAAAGNEMAAYHYDWMMLEMYDQTVRNSSGGDMINWLAQPIIKNESYVFSRIGKGGEQWRQQLLQPELNTSTSPNLLKKIWRRPGIMLKALQKAYLRVVLPGRHYKIYKTGQFRYGGEIHQWMYDRYSLGRLLKDIGFREIIERSATESYLTAWASYGLDDSGETASLFMEARKPS
jgi:predicted SAM-dependent methyltransferase